MKRRTFLKALSAFLAAPLAFFGAKKIAVEVYTAYPRPNYLTDNDMWFLKNGSTISWDNTKSAPLTLKSLELMRERLIKEFKGGYKKHPNTHKGYIVLPKLFKEI